MIPIAFTAVVFSFDETGEGLVVSQRPLPNQDPFDKAEVVYRDPTVTSLKLSYMDDSSGWKDTWDGAEARATPRAVKLIVTTTLNGRVAELPPLTVSLPIAPPQ